MNETPPAISANPPKKPGKKGCLIGCLVAAGVGAVLAIILGVKIYSMLVNKAIPATHTLTLVQKMVMSRIADEDERILVMVKASKELAPLFETSSPIEPAFVSNLVERIIAERVESRKSEVETPKNNIPNE